MNKPFHIFPEAASEMAVEVDYVTYALLGIVTFFSVGIALAIVIFIARYWHSRPVDRTFHPSRLTHWVVELTWMIIPLMILLVMFFWGATVYVHAHRPPDDALEVNVVAKQWMWKVAHRSGRREINALHVPVGRPVRLTLISEDVIHSFFVPAFRVKQDVLPGRYTTLWFEAIKPGSYHLFCAEYCGTDHSKMIGEVVVMEPEEYARWSESEQRDSLAQAGRRRVESLGCLQCHGLIDGRQAGPALPGLYGQTVLLASGEAVRADDNYLRRSILEPASQMRAGFTAKMPSYEGQIDPEAMLEIIAYLRSIADASGPLAGPGGNTGAAQEGSSSDQDSSSSDQDNSSSDPKSSSSDKGEQQ